MMEHTITPLKFMTINWLSHFVLIAAAKVKHIHVHNIVHTERTRFLCTSLFSEWCYSYSHVHIVNK